MITLYTSGPWADRDKVREIAGKFRLAGYNVNSRWLDVPEETPEGMTKDDWMRMQALHDLEDTINCDVLIFCNTGTLSEGKAVELGVSLALLKPIIIVGEGGRVNNLFLNLNIPHFVTAEEAIEWMKAEERAAEVKKTGIVEV